MVCQVVVSAMEKITLEWAASFLTELIGISVKGTAADVGVQDLW